MYADANRTLVNTYLADRRRGRSRELLAGWLPESAAERATAVEPPIRPVARNALLDGRRRRRRRRVSAAVACVVAVAAASVIVPSATGPDHVVPGPTTGSAPTLYVAGTDGPVTVQSISTITNQAGKPIRTGDYNSGGQ